MPLNRYQQAYKDAGEPAIGSSAYNDFIFRTFGGIDRSSLPQGSTIISEIPGVELRYRDAEGYEHTIGRRVDFNQGNAGQIYESGTNRPDVVPLTSQFPQLRQLLENAIASVQGGLANLDPNAIAALKAMSDSTNEQLTQDFTRQGGELAATLYGRGTNRSTVANDLAGKLTQAQGMIRNQAASDAANRELQVRQFVTNNLSNLLNSITGQETSRSQSSAQIGLGRDQLEQQAYQFQQQYQLEQERLRQMSRANSPWSRILSGALGAGLNLFAPGIGSLFGTTAARTSSDPNISFE